MYAWCASLSQPHVVRWIERHSPGGRTHLALQDTEALGVIVCFVIREIELLGELSWCGNDVLMFGQFRLAADAGVGGIFTVGRWRRDDGAHPIIFDRRNWPVGIACHRLPLHYEDQAYAKQTTSLQAFGGITQVWDRIAVSTAFKITMVEGIGVVFTSWRSVPQGGLLIPASLGAVAALLVVVVLGLVLHRPVAMIPENTLKFVVGVLLCSFGTFWVGEGMRLSWPGGDWSIPALNAGFLVAALIAVPMCRARIGAPAVTLGR